MGETNEKRIDRAALALAFYARLIDSSRLDDGWQNRDEVENAVIDLLADLQHFCKAEDVDFAAAIKNAQEHFEEESQEESPEKPAGSTAQE